MKLLILSLVGFAFGTCACVGALSIPKNDPSDDGSVEEEKVVNTENPDYAQVKYPGVNVGGCQSNEDCPEEQCCTVGMTRYSVPTCLPLGQMNDPCIPNNDPQNFTLSYPSEEIIQVTESFLLFCPCAPLFECNKDSVSCQSRTQFEDDSLDRNDLTE